MRTSTASAARWRTGSRSSNWTCSPTGPVATGSWPTSSGCCLSSAAYVLVQALRRTALRGTDLAKAQVGTIRLKLFKVAARVVVIGPSGRVPPGQQLPVRRAVSDGLRACHEPSHAGEGGGGLTGAKTGRKTALAERGSGGDCARAAASRSSRKTS